MANEMVPKRLDLLHEVLPAATTIALLDNPANPATPAQTVQMRAIASGMGITLPVLHAGSESELEAAFGAPVIPENFIRRDLRREAESAHHRT